MVRLILLKMLLGRDGCIMQRYIFTPSNSFWDDFGALNNYVACSQSFLQAGKTI